MASAFRFCASKLLARNSVAGLCKPAPCGSANLTNIQVAFIAGKALRSLDYKRPAPYPYETETYTKWNALWDSTVARMDENSKIVVVEGPIAAGKTAFAKMLAADLDMKYMPPVTMDMEYINAYGFDERQLDPQLPVSCQSYDVKNFCTDPYHLNCAAYQILMYYHRYCQYIDALAHLFSTGQGVVLQRCCYSDVIFVEAMHNAGYISKAAKTTYHEIIGLTLPELLPPHLCIYLDVPTAVVQEKIKKRGIPYEVNSKVFSTEYLEFMENMYKQQYLKELSKHANLLIYDWTDEGDAEVVIEDIERLNFDIQRDDDKFKYWRFWDDNTWNMCRRQYADKKAELLTHFSLGQCDVPELNIPGLDQEQFDKIWLEAPGNRFIKGFNANMGDKGILWKFFPKSREYRV